jgi:hypothetical protein
MKALAILGLLLANVSMASDSCDGMPYTQDDALKLFQPGQYSVVFQNFSCDWEYRNCNVLTGCGAWIASAPVNYTMTFEAGTAINVRLAGNDFGDAVIGSVGSLTGDKMAFGIVQVTRYIYNNWYSAGTVDPKDIHLSGEFNQNCMQMDGSAKTKPSDGWSTEQTFHCSVQY